MDLNKDNRDVYTIDSENYSIYMEKDRKKPRDLLGFLIQFLIVILLFVVVYFFFNILKNDLSFSEVFNKKELLLTYESLIGSNEKSSLEKETYPEAMVTEKKSIEAKEILLESKLPIKNLEKKEVAKVETVVKHKVVTTKSEPTISIKEIIVEKITPKEKVVVVKEEPTPLKRIEKVEVKKAVVKEEPEEGELTESYLDRMVAELNSEI